MRSHLADASAPGSAADGVRTIQQQLDQLHLRGSQETKGQLRTAPAEGGDGSVRRRMDQLDSFRINLYLSLIPKHLIPRHLFNIDSRTGFVELRKPTDCTIQFLQQLEALWQAADFAEDVAMDHIAQAVQRRQDRFGAEGNELTTVDLEDAISRVSSAASTP